MITQSVNKIIIFGGGTSGWLTAAYMAKNLQGNIKITLIEDVSAGPIGVGEGTQPLTAKFLYECGIDAKKWMKPSNAAFKYGVELSGWNDEPYFVDNDSTHNYMPSQTLFVNKYFIDKPYSEYAAWHPAYRLAKLNKSPKLDTDLDINFGSGPDGYGAVHFSAYDIIKTLKKIIGNKIEHIDAKIKQVETDIHGITKLRADDGREFSADLYIDCSGFKSSLLEKTMGSEYICYNENGWLFNDSAVAMPTEYKNPQEECHPYTKATTMNAGWRWTIPTYHRIGNGYVYSSKFISKDKAEQELRKAVNDFETPVNHLKMRCGTHKEAAVKNVCGVGLSAGFIEPLEATGITFTTALAKSITDLLNLNNGIWDGKVIEIINQGFYEMCVEILAFVYIHYFFSTRKDTEYWQAIRKQKIEDLPTDVQRVIQLYWPKPENFIFMSPQSMFSSVQWFSIIHAGEGYSHLKNKMTKEEEKYLEYFIDVQNKRVDLAKDLFPNHYDFLNEWYNEWKIN